MLYMAAVKGLNRKHAVSRTEELLRLINLEDVAGKKIKSYSGGMKQRLGIAQAELNHPEIPILDEPTAQGLTRKNGCAYVQAAEPGYEKEQYTDLLVPLTDEYIAATIREYQRLFENPDNVGYETLTDPCLRQLMRYRYIDGTNWEQISELLHYDPDGRNVHKFHLKALNQINI